MLQWKHVEEIRDELEVGDLIEFHRDDYNHWGIYIGNNKVVHITDNSGVSSAGNSISSFNSFGSGGLMGNNVYVRCDELEKVAGSEFRFKF